MVEDRWGSWRVVEPDREYRRTVARRRRLRRPRRPVSAGDPLELQRLWWR
jgi:hypothetical protein